MRATFVLRGAVSKELKPLASRLMGWMMGADAKPKTERKDGRTVVVVAAEWGKAGRRQRPLRLGMVARADRPGDGRPVSGRGRIDHVARSTARPPAPSIIRSPRS